MDLFNYIKGHLTKEGKLVLLIVLTFFFFKLEHASLTLLLAVLNSNITRSLLLEVGDHKVYSQRE